MLKIWNTSRIFVSSLCRGHANLLCVIPILVYVLPKWALQDAFKLTYIKTKCNYVEEIICYSTSKCWIISKIMGKKITSIMFFMIMIHCYISIFLFHPFIFSGPSFSLFLSLSYSLLLLFLFFLFLFSSFSFFSSFPPSLPSSLSPSLPPSSPSFLPSFLPLFLSFFLSLYFSDIPLRKGTSEFLGAPKGSVDTLPILKVLQNILENIVKNMNFNFQIILNLYMVNYRSNFEYLISEKLLFLYTLRTIWTFFYVLFLL